MRDGVNARGKIFTWGIRVVALVLLIIIFSVSITQFYAAEDPSKVRSFRERMLHIQCLFDI